MTNPNPLPTPLPVPSVCLAKQKVSGFLQVPALWSDRGQLELPPVCHSATGAAGQAASAATEHRRKGSALPEGD